MFIVFEDKKRQKRRGLTNNTKKKTKTDAVLKKRKVTNLA